jgi:DNA-binding CsgD family transcriptional regulator
MMIMSESRVGSVLDDPSRALAPASVLARFVLRGASCVIVPQAAADCAACIASFELSGEGYAILKIDEEGRRDLLDLLTPRELQIALLIAAGRESKAVARYLRISFHTVRVHLGRIYVKLGLHKQTELAGLVSARYGALGGCSRRASDAILSAGSRILSMLNVAVISGLV